MKESPTQADAIIVLGGGLDNRPGAAAALYHQGFSTKILVLDPRSPDKDEALLPTDAEAASKILQTKGVPIENIEIIGKGVASTMEELQAVREWATTHLPKKIIIPTDALHTRRVNTWADRVLGPLQIDTRVIPIEPHHYSSEEWWKHEAGVVSFQNEILKSIYYWVRSL